MLEVKDLSAKRGDFFLKDVSLTVLDGEYFVLLGPTGAGKTVLLESITGITGIRGGQIWIDGKDVTSLNVQERNIGFAYQKYTLYRHLPVRDNISFGLMWRYKSQKAIDEAVDGDTVLVTNGTYILPAQLSVSKGITLTSIAGAEATFIDANDGDRSLFLSHSNAVVDGFTFTGSR